MNVPFQFGWPQVLLLLIGLVGLWLCITAGLGLLSPHRFLSEDEKERYRRTGYLPRRRFKVTRVLSGLVLLAVAISLLWLTFLVQSYLGLTGEIKVAHIRATPIANVSHQMSVEVMLYDGNGHITSENTYLLQGDEWMVQGDIIKFPAWLNIVGLHAGYKLTRLEGRYDDMPWRTLPTILLYPSTGAMTISFKQHICTNNGLLHSSMPHMATLCFKRQDHLMCLQRRMR